MDMLKTLSQALFARLYTQLPGRARKQRGASALEYIVLAAALIIIIGVLATNDTVSGALETAFTNLFTDASDTTPPAS